MAAACTSTGDGAARVGRVETKIAWVDSRHHWVSRPVTAGGRFVAYYEGGDLLHLAGLHPLTGAEVWRMQASASALTPGVALDVAHDGDVVYVGLPIDILTTDKRVFVAAIDANSGSEIWRTSEPLFLSDTLSTCDEDSHLLCGSAVTVDGTQVVRITKTTGEATTSPPPTPGVAFDRRLGAGLHDLGGRDPELISRIDQSGRILWTKTTSELFAGRAVSSDRGWIWEQYGNVIVGSLGWINRDQPTFDLAQTTITALDAATGAIIWLDDGADLYCGLLGGLAPSPSPLRCRRTGMVSYDSDGEPQEVTGLNVVMERFDPMTGATLWGADLGAAESLVIRGSAVVRLSPAEFAVERQDGSTVVVNIETGRTRPSVDGDAGWCASENKYPDVRAAGRIRVGARYVTPCQADGSTPDVLPLSPLDSAARFEQTFVWVDAAGMHAATTG